jgi:predicted dinucleotide-utilizing enzyme
VVERECLWTDEGLAVARRRKVALEEVEQALHAPPGLRFERRIGDPPLVVMGMAGSARVVAVVCEQLHRTTKYRILSVKALAGVELDEWRRRVL